MDLDRLQELLWSFAGQRVITVAARTGILGSLAAKRATPEQVARDLGLDPQATAKVVRALTALGLLSADDLGTYHVVSGLAPHLREGPDDLTPFIQHTHDLYESWGEHLEPWVRGEPWATRPRGPEGRKRFGAAMHAMGAVLAQQVAAALEMEGKSRMLDLGGGLGQYAEALCRTWPALQATVLDVPEVAELGRAALAGTGLQGRITFLGGDYLESDAGTGYDLVLLASVLHQESARRAAALVRRGAGALAPGGRLAVVDFSIDDRQQGSVLGALFAINMRSFGDTHTEPTLRTWMEQAGLNRVTRTDLGPHRWLIVGHRPV